MVFKVGEAANPLGKGGFGERPEDRASGYWKASDSISFQYKKFLKMSEDELKAWSKNPSSSRTVAQGIAYARILASQRSLKDAREVTDRTEGKAPQSIDLTSGGEPMRALVEFIHVGDDEPSGE